MEGERKSNTAMLTVIAIATLLVAVVGATFAYFSASTTNTADVTVTAETKAADAFTASSTGDITLDVEAKDMQQSAGSNDYSSIASTDTATVTVGLTAGSGTATCTYDLVYTPSSTSPNIIYTATQNTYNEFAISGTSTFDATHNDFDDVNITGSNAITLKNDATITAVSGTPASDTWTLTGNYYNLEVDQKDAAGHTYGGSITVTDVKCSNTATQTTP